MLTKGRSGVSYQETLPINPPEKNNALAKVSQNT